MRSCDYAEHGRRKPLARLEDRSLYLITLLDLARLALHVKTKSNEQRSRRDMPRKGRGQSIAAGGAENEGSKQTKGGQKKTRAAGIARDQNAIGSGETAVGSSERASKVSQNGLVFECEGGEAESAAIIAIGLPLPPWPCIARPDPGSQTVVCMLQGQQRLHLSEHQRAGTPSSFPLFRTSGASKGAKRQGQSYRPGRLQGYVQARRACSEWSICYAGGSSRTCCLDWLLDGTASFAPQSLLRLHSAKLSQFTLLSVPVSAH